MDGGRVDGPRVHGSQLFDDRLPRDVHHDDAVRPDTVRPGGHHEDSGAAEGHGPHRADGYVGHRIGRAGGTAGGRAQVPLPHSVAGGRRGQHRASRIERHPEGRTGARPR